MTTTSSTARQWTLPDHAEYELEPHEFRQVKRALSSGMTPLECAKKYEQQVLQVSYAMHCKTYTEYQEMRAELAPQKFSRALTVYRPR